MNDLQKLRKRLKRGRIYRRAELAKYSKSADRYLRQLVDSGELKKLWFGVYYRPRMCCVGEVPPEMSDVVRAYLKTDDFYMTSLSFYNGLRLGTTQIYNESLVYNNKRHGRIVLNNQNYYFLKNRKFPPKATEEFMLVDMLNNLDMLAEDREKVKKNIGRRAVKMGKEKIRQVANMYGKVSTRKFLEEVFQQEPLFKAKSACSDWECADSSSNSNWEIEVIRT